MREELKMALLGKRFVFAFLAMFVCIWMRILPDWLVSADWGDYRPDALHLVIGSIFFGGVMLVLPFCATLPHAISNVDEVQTSFLYWKAMRSPLRKLARLKIISTALSCGLCVMLPFVINIVIWNIVAVPIDPITYPQHEQMFSDGVLYNDWYGVMYGLPMYISTSLGIFLNGALWALVGLAVSVWLPDKLLVMTIPVGVYFLWLYNLPRWMFGVTIPHPSSLFNDGLTLEVLVQGLIATGVSLVLAIAAYYAGLKRRVQHG